MSQTWKFLTSPDLAPIFWPGVVTALVVAIMCSMLSVLVVLKRMAFIGQGVSHAAFGGVGFAAIFGVAGAMTAAASVAQFMFVLTACIIAALLMAWISERGRTESDSAIGIVLVGSMALGSVLVRYSKEPVQWESFLFGDMLAISWADAGLAGVVSMLVCLSLWAIRRPLIFWAFDETASRAWGVWAKGMHFSLVVLLALCTVTAMKLAGVILATAILVLPGATALKLTRSWGLTLLYALGVGLAGVLAGVVVSFEANWPPGPSIVLVLTLIFGVALAYERLMAMRHTKVLR